MEMALRSTAGMTEEDAAAMNAITTGQEAKPVDQLDIPFVFEHIQQKQQLDNNKNGSLHLLPPSGPTTESIEIEIEAATARRFTTYSSEDALAGMLFDTIVSPQTVLPDRAAEARNLQNTNNTGAVVGASATKPKPTRAEALATVFGDLGTGMHEGCIDLKNLMSAGQQQAVLNEASLQGGAMQISPGLLASLSADLECPQDGVDVLLPVTRELFV